MEGRRFVDWGPDCWSCCIGEVGASRVVWCLRIVKSFAGSLGLNQSRGT